MEKLSKEVTDAKRGQFTGLYSKHMFNKVGQFSNINTAARNFMTELGWDSSEASKEDQLYAAISRSFFELFEQDAISSKKVFQRLAANNVNNTNSNILSESEDDYNPDPSKYVDRSILRTLYDVLNVSTTHGIDFQSFFELMKIDKKNKKNKIYYKVIDIDEKEVFSLVKNKNDKFLFERKYGEHGTARNFFVTGIKYDREIFFLITGYDPAYRSYCPTHYMLYQIMEKYHKEGYNTILYTILYC